MFTAAYCSAASWQISACTKHRVYCKESYIYYTCLAVAFSFLSRFPMVQGQAADACCAYEPLQSVTHTFFSRGIDIDIRAARPAADGAWHASCRTGR